MRTLLLLTAGLFMTGCAQESVIATPGLDHPANPDAVEAPVPPPPSLGAAPPLPSEATPAPESTEPGKSGMPGMPGMHGHSH